jgi:hypothetical protein
MASSKSNPTLTEKQSLRLSELEAKSSLTAKQASDMASLLVRKENGTKNSLSDGCIDYLVSVYAWEVYGRVPISKELMEVDQMRKGKMVENDSIELLSFIDDTIYTKNDQRIHNEFLSGEPDVIITGLEDIPTKIIDIKSSFDLPGFFMKAFSEPPLSYTYQVQGYCDISGALEGEIAYCLVNSPETMISDAKRKLLYMMNVATEENTEFKETWANLERSMVFDDIPASERVIRFDIEPFTDEERNKVYDRVKVCREWLWNFDEKHRKIKKSVPLMQNESV